VVGLPLPRLTAVSRFVGIAPMNLDQVIFSYDYHIGANAPDKAIS
jgi:hypothetical protein